MSERQYTNTSINPSILAFAPANKLQNTHKVYKYADWLPVKLDSVKFNGNLKYCIRPLLVIFIFPRCPIKVILHFTQVFSSHRIYPLSTDYFFDWSRSRKSCMVCWVETYWKYIRNDPGDPHVHTSKINSYAIAIELTHQSEFWNSPPKWPPELTSSLVIINIFWYRSVVKNWWDVTDFLFL